MLFRRNMQKNNSFFKFLILCTFNAYSLTYYRSLEFLGRKLKKNVKKLQAKFIETLIS